MDNIIIDKKEFVEGTDLAIESMIKTLREVCPDSKLIDFSIHANFEVNDTSCIRVAMEYTEGGYQNVNIGIQSIGVKHHTSLEEDGDK